MNFFSFFFFFIYFFYFFINFFLFVYLIFFLFIFFDFFLVLLFLFDDDYDLVEMISKMDNMKLDLEILGIACFGKWTQVVSMIVSHVVSFL